VENGVLVLKAIYDPPPLQPGSAYESEIGLYRAGLHEKDVSIVLYMEFLPQKGKIKL